MCLNYDTRLSSTAFEQIQLLAAEHFVESSPVEKADGVDPELVQKEESAAS